jgi:hypothetical protein
MPKRQGNRPERRIEPAGTYDAATLATLARAMRYAGSALHKLRPGDWGFHPPTNPRPHKSVCDEMRSILTQEAKALFGRGVERGMISAPGADGRPKYVWAVDDAGEVYEAKESKSDPGAYHGYRLSEDEPMRAVVLKEWEGR